MGAARRCGLAGRRTRPGGGRAEAPDTRQGVGLSAGSEAGRGGARGRGALRVVVAAALVLGAGGMAVPKIRSMPSTHQEHIAAETHKTTNMEPHVWNWDSQMMQEPEYTPFSSQLVDRDAEKKRRYVLEHQPNEWPRKAGSWGSGSAPLANAPLNNIVRILEKQEAFFYNAFLTIRASLRRVDTLNKIMMLAGNRGKGKVFLPESVDEANRWANVTSSLAFHISGFQKSSDALMSTMASMVSIGGVDEELDGELHQNKAAAAAISGQAFADPPRPMRVDGTAAGGAGQQEQPSSIATMSSKGRMTPVLGKEVEEAFRIDTWYEVPIFSPKKLKDGSYEYPEETELHIVWDMDQAKVVGEGTNDVELVLKCVLWWKEELQHDQMFIPPGVPDEIRKEFKQFCEDFDLEKAFRSIAHLLCRPGIQDFVKAHPQAKFWTFTNKDREDGGQILRDVSDEDGLCGMYQDDPHEVSGRRVVDANKLALAILDKVANEYAGIKNEERPVIGARGQMKDLSRIAGLIWERRRKARAAGDNVENKPITMILMDDKCQDAYAHCQTNDKRLLCHVPAYQAVNEEQGIELKEAMERLLPVDKLLKFYQAFRSAEPSHALVQCVDISSDDASTLLKRQGPAQHPRFTYVPKTIPASNKLPELPLFKPVLRPSPQEEWAE